ncbi:MAG: alpha/beta hydrolase, partial [Clostridia bacterium]|nr:alpha/beta hydrolase [Clostridia bacterium]
VADLKKIEIPTLVLAGENDVIKRAHTQLIASSIANSTLIIVPNETHSSYIIHSKKLYNLIHEFLNI